ncbi:MAG: DUF1778 domain-containing protein [Myxococcales bacterium]|nr:DUF1778 domain-containing protein [Myxococcales bacterium]
MSTQSARLELRIAPESKELIDRAAQLCNTTITAFVTEVVLARAKEVVEGPAEPRGRRPRPIGGWSFELPDDWDDPIVDMSEYR